MMPQTLLQRCWSPTDRRLWQLALPMIFSNITIPLLGLVDTAVIGHLDSAVYLSAVAVGGMVLAFLTMMFNFLRMSTTGITAQAKGAQDKNGPTQPVQTDLIQPDLIQIEPMQNSNAALLQALGQPLLLSGLLSLLLLLLQQPLIQLGLLISGVSGVLREYAELYLQIRFWAIPATLANLVLLGWLLGMQKMKAPVLLLVCGNITNIVLDVVLVLYADWQVRGVAVASVCAEYVTLLMGLWLVWRTVRAAQVTSNRGEKPQRMIRSLLGDRATWRKNSGRLLSLNRDIFLRSLVLQLCFASFTVLGARVGGDTVATNALLLNFLTFTAFALDGFAYAIEALTGHAIGARDQRTLRTVWRAACRQSLLLAALFSLTYALWGQQIIAQLTHLPALQSQANIYLPWLVVLPLIGVWCYLLDGLFIGATRGREMRNSMLLAGCGYALTVAVGFMLDHGQNHALWLALMVFLALRGVSLEYYRRTRLMCEV